MAPDQKSQGIKIIFLVALLASLSVFFFHANIALFPSFIHAWTQSDRYALALGFLNNGFDFFHPQTFNLATTGGITRVDFPVHEYIVAIIMKLTGNHNPVVFRVYVLLYALAGLIFLFRLSGLFHQSYLKNIFVVLFLFSCPVFLYYADGFIPSIPSLSNLLIGYYFYFRYKKEMKVRDFRLAILFLTIAALARLPFFIFLVSIFCQQVIGYFKNKKIQRQEVLPFGIAFAAFGSYQIYNSYLGKKYGSQFLVTFLPPHSLAQMREWISDTWLQWRFEYLTPSHYLILGSLIAIAFFFVLIKKTAAFQLTDLALQALIAFAGSVLFFLVMLQQFPDHDYYFIDAFYPIVILLLVLLLHFSFSDKYLKGTYVLLLAALTFQSFKSANETLHKRYESGPWDRVEITRKNFTGAEKYLDSIGVRGDAKILVLDGYTTNVPLILMNRKGWTVNWTTKENIEEGMLKPFDLVAVQNSFVASDVVKNDPGIINRLEKIADNGLVSFYRKKNNSNQTLDKFFGIDTSTILFNETKSDSILVDENSEFKDLFSGPALNLKSRQPAKILITCKILVDVASAPQLIASVSEREENSSYFSFELHDYIADSRGWQEMMFQFVIPASQNPLEIVKVYFWNKQKGRFSIEGLRLVIYR